MRKPTVYLDASVISAYWYEGTDVLTLARRLRTRDWWEYERSNFTLWTSAGCEAELRAGRFPKQRECLKMVRRVRYLTATSAVEQLQELLTERRLVPTTKSGDAGHLAIAAIHGMDYLLTWNYAHMANANAQMQLEKLCKERRLIAPLMVSPESIPQVRFGQSIRRSGGHG
jgi:hypothetical protein